MIATRIDEAARARAALAVIPADDYATWVDMAFALKHGFGDAGFDIWDTWSQSAPNYSERAARTTWRSARASGGKTLASLFWLAQQHGFDLSPSVHDTAGRLDEAAASPTRRETPASLARDAQALRARHAAVALEAESIWRWARPVGPAHPYLLRKQLEPTPMLRELEALELHALLGYEASSAGTPLNGRVLIVPVWKSEVMSTLELIDEHGHKSSLAGGAKKGGYWRTGPAQLNAQSPSLLLIGEGVATVLSAHRATGWWGAAALSSGNLREVASVLREQWPSAELLVLGELGHGEAHAIEAVKHVGGRLALPTFAPNARVGGATPTDFNDMAVLYGANTVGKLLRDVAFREGPGVSVAPGPRAVFLSELVTRIEPEEGREMGRVKESRVSEAGDVGDAGNVDDPSRSARRNRGGKTGHKTEPETQNKTDRGTGVKNATPGEEAHTAAPTEAPTEAAEPARAYREIGDTLFALDDVPLELKLLAQHRFGTPLRMATPRENGGPYRGEVLNTERYLIQEVSERSVVFHAKDRLEFVSDRLRWMDEHQRMNGADLQIGYEGDRPKAYPWDRMRDQLERTVSSLKTSAREVGFGSDLDDTLDQLQASSWTRIREARATALAQSKERLARETNPEPDR